MSKVTTPDKTINRILLRIMWLPFLLAIVSIIDRGNVSYAELRMSDELDFSGAVYGLGAGIVFLGYFLFEIPSNMLLRKLGARVWLTRIAISWGILAALNSIITNEPVFYILRFLLGAAEAGLFPGVILYVTYWFPLRARGRATGLFMAAVPIASIIGSPISGWIVGFNNILGMSGWRFMFIVWGLPAIVIGILLGYLLPNSPDEVSWLSGKEKSLLKGELVSEAKANEEGGRERFSFAFKDRNTYIFTACYFCYGVGQWGMIFFLPDIISRLNYTPTQVGFIATAPFVVGLIAMLVVSRHSDKTNEQIWHWAIPMLVAGVCLITAGLTTTVAPMVSLIFLTITGAGIFSALGTFWPRASAMLTGAAAAAGIAIINSVGNISGFVSPYVMGILQDVSGNNILGLFFMGILVLIGAILWLIGVKRRNLIPEVGIEDRKRGGEPEGSEKPAESE